jgi:hypothetical protein
MTITAKNKIHAIFVKDPNRLLSIIDVAGELNEEYTPSVYKRIENVIRNLRIDGEVHRHKDRDINKDLQYAVNMKEDNIEPWVLNDNLSKGLKGTPKGKGAPKRKGRLLDKKEIQSMFAAQYNNLAKLEDEAMKIIEQFEATEKEMTKIRNFIGR